MLEIRDALSITIEELASEMTRCFEDYIIPIVFSRELLSSLLRLDAMDLLATRLGYEGDAMVGVCCICRRGESARVGAMAVAKPFRGRGIGKKLMDRAILDAVQRGDKRMVLEAIESNSRAISFYESLGFRTVFRLLSFSRPLPDVQTKSRLREIGFEEMAHLLYREGETFSSWETELSTISNLANPAKAFAVGDFGIAVSPSGDQDLVCRSLAPSGQGDDAKLEAILEDLGQIYPGRILRVPPFFPEPVFKDLLLAANFKQDRISQVQMELAL